MCMLKWPRITKVVVVERKTDSGEKVFSERW